MRTELNAEEISWLCTTHHQNFSDTLPSHGTVAHCRLAEASCYPLAQEGSF